MTKIGLITCKVYPNLYADDLLMAEVLKAKGLTTAAVIWDDPLVTWTDYSFLILRSVWDYHKNHEKFIAWLNHIEDLKIRILNSVQVIKNNLHKGYLLDFQDRGLRIIPTKLIGKGNVLNLSEILENSTWERAVIKPAISLSAHNTFLVSSSNVEHFQDTFSSLIAENDLLIQPFIPEIKTHGEISLIFINRKYSHAILKKPLNNDFRVQQEFGGKKELYKASDSLISQAQEYLKHVGGDLLYARVDGVLYNQQFYLMELELIDPVLHFETFPEAIQMFHKELETFLSWE